MARAAKKYFRELDLEHGRLARKRIRTMLPFGGGYPSRPATARALENSDEYLISSSAEAFDTDGVPLEKEMKKRKMRIQES